MVNRPTVTSSKDVRCLGLTKLQSPQVPNYKQFSYKKKLYFDPFHLDRLPEDPLDVSDDVRPTRGW